MTIFYDYSGLYWREFRSRILEVYEFYNGDKTSSLIKNYDDEGMSCLTKIVFSKVKNNINE